MELTYRPRRLRRSPALRAMVRETSVNGLPATVYGMQPVSPPTSRTS